MKYIFTKLLLLTTLIFGLTSCELREEIVVHKDGKMDYKLVNDFSEVMKSMPSGKNVDTSFDTIFSFKDIMLKAKDSIYKNDSLTDKEKKALSEFLANFKSVNIQFQMIPEKDIFSMGMTYKADEVKSSVKSLPSLLSLFSQNKSINSKGVFNTKGKGEKVNLDEFIKKIESGELFAYDVQDSFKKNVFRRNFTVKDKAILDSIYGGEKNIFKNFKIKSVTKFPKPVKETNLKDAYFSLDRKTMIYEYSVYESLLNHTTSDWEVILEN